MGNFQVFLSISLVSVVFADSTLRLVNLVYRHGDRSPVVIYPKDINQVDKWPQGLGWLSKLGEQEQYRLGQWLKDRYMSTGFMNNTYRREEILVHSSDEDRCLMSAYSNLAGLYPPDVDQQFNPAIKWQPIPVFTRPKPEDNMLNMGEYCPRYNDLLQQTLSSHAVTEEEIKNKPFYEFLGKMTGFDHENISNIWQIADTTYCEKAHGMNVSSWINDTVFQKLRELEAYQFTLLFYTPEMSMLKGGPLLSQFIKNMNNKKTLKTLKTKMFMYSAHDTTVAALLSALGLYDKKSPMYTATVIVELHEKPANNYYVNIFYKNVTDNSTAYKLTLPKCTADCPLDDFIRLTQWGVPTDWLKQCGLPPGDTPSGSSTLTTGWIVAIALGCVLFIFVIATIACFVRMKRKNNPFQFGKLEVSS
ncbi:lysosomal acid phosphatase-like [Ruditapes philippinarum]|uniref:lysosomal acid phosphatase-like n=1 Tax=Ruditapes philippinarum TaxID=129788 RepID=UPI00295BECE8|nr:lysosomal acid phosphatase-like [Ruditapes philippinarum]